MNLNDPRLMVAGALLFSSGLGIGLAVGRALTFKKLDAEYDVRLAEETVRIDKFHKMMRKEPPYDDIRTAAKAYSERLDELDAHIVNPSDVYATITTDENILPRMVAEGLSIDGRDVEGFVTNLGYAAEEHEESEIVQELDPAETATDELAKIMRISPRDSGDPYIVTVQEFFDECDDYDTHSVTYYEDDRMLVDDRGSIISDIEVNLGPDYNLAFGLGSGEPHVVYIRNPRRSNDYEVLREPGSYTEDVLGVAPADNRKTARRKMRDSDE